MARLETKKAVDVIDGFVKLREPDLNRRPRGYEPRELPSCSIPRVKRYRLWISCLALREEKCGEGGRPEAIGWRHLDLGDRTGSLARRREGHRVACASPLELPGRFCWVFAACTEAEEMAENRWLAPMRLRGCGHWECMQSGGRKPLASADAAKHRVACASPFELPG